MTFIIGGKMIEFENLYYKQQEIPRDSHVILEPWQKHILDILEATGLKEVRITYKRDEDAHVNKSSSDNKILFEAVSYRPDGKFIENETDAELSAKEVTKVIKDVWDDMPADYYSWKLKEVRKW